MITGSMKFTTLSRLNSKISSYDSNLGSCSAPLPLRVIRRAAIAIRPRLAHFRKTSCDASSDDKRNGFSSYLRNITSLVNLKGDVLVLPVTGNEGLSAANFRDAQQVCIKLALSTIMASVVLLTVPTQMSYAEEDLAARCATETCKEMMNNLAAKKAAMEAGEPIESRKLTKEERRAKRYRERARMEEQTKQFSREKQAFAREERAYLIKYRTMDETAIRLDKEGVPFEQRRPIVEKAGQDAFNEAMKEQEAYEREQAGFEERLAAKRIEAAQRAEVEAESRKALEAERKAQQKLIEQEQKLCKNGAVCS